MHLLVWRPENPHSTSLRTRRAILGAEDDLPCYCNGDSGVILSLARNSAKEHGLRMIHVRRAGATNKDWQ
jgi:hypothetical protein